MKIEMKFVVTTKFNDEVIDQVVVGPGTKELFRSILSLQEDGVREALIRLGWTPPATEPATRDPDQDAPPLAGWVPGHVKDFLPATRDPGHAPSELSDGEIYERASLPGIDAIELLDKLDRSCPLSRDSGHLGIPAQLAKANEAVS